METRITTTREIIFIQTDDGATFLDAASGAELWRTTSYSAFHPSNAALYATDADRRLVRLKPQTGAVRWQSADDVGVPTFAHDETLYTLAADGAITALRADSGATVWRTAPGSYVRGLAVKDGMLIAQAEYHATPGVRSSDSLGGALVMLDAASGARRWSYAWTYAGDVSIDGHDDHRLPFAYRAGVVYFIAFDDQLRAHTAADGQALWDQQLSAPIVAAPLLGDGVVYVGSNARLVALDAATGRSLWRSKLGAPWWDVQGILGATRYVMYPVTYLARIGEHIGVEVNYISAHSDTSDSHESGSLTLISATGAPSWSHYFNGGVRLLGELDGVLGCPSISAYVHTFDALDATTGAVRWSRDILTFAPRLRGLRGSRYFYAFFDDRLHALAPQDGEIFWSRRVITNAFYHSSNFIRDWGVIAG